MVFKELDVFTCLVESVLTLAMTKTFRSLQCMQPAIGSPMMPAPCPDFGHFFLHTLCSDQWRKEVATFGQFLTDA